MNAPISENSSGDSGGSEKYPMNFWSACAIGIGTMVGAGIFALLGEATMRCGRDCPLVFILGGIIALLAGYSYARLSALYPGEGGLNIYFRAAFGNGIIAGALPILYYITLMVASAMIAKSFGAYVVLLCQIGDGYHFIQNTAAVLLIFILAVINAAGAKGTGQIELILVTFKLTVLTVLAVAGAAVLKPEHLELYTPVPWGDAFAAVAVVFFAYAGFGTITNASGLVRNSRKTIPAAIYTSISIVAILYIALSFILLTTVTPDELLKNKDAAVAMAAQPVLGRFGFVIVGIAALVATASAINGSLFSALHIASDLAAHQQLPEGFNRSLWRRGSWGFVGSIALVMLFAVIFGLSSIANMASATFLICYLGVQFAHWRIRHDTHGSPIIIAFGIIAILAVLLAFFIQIGQTKPFSLGIIFAFVLFSILVEAWVIKARDMSHK